MSPSDCIPRIAMEASTEGSLHFNNGSLIVCKGHCCQEEVRNPLYAPDHPAQLFGSVLHFDWRAENTAQGVVDNREFAQMSVEGGAELSKTTHSSQEKRFGQSDPI